MATAENRLTPVSDRTPAIVSIPDKELSGDQWVSRFTGSARLDDLIEPFQTNVRSFKSAIEAAGASVRISATYRPVERAYMMHWSYLIAKGAKKAKDIPALSGVNIEWDHGDEKKSIAAAKEMTSGFEIDNLKTTPALASNHTKKLAIDMTISWKGTLTIQNADDEAVVIESSPRDGMNPDLIKVGASYNVIKYNRTGTDKPHWSVDGA
jgi:hypothetical protein